MFKSRIKQALRAAIEPAEGVAEDCKAGWSEGKAFPSFIILFTLFTFNIYSQEIQLPEITTYIESPVVEQRQVLDRDEIEQLNASDLPQLLQSCGIQLLSYGSYGLENKPSIRGFTDETVRVVIDGVCMNNAQYGTFDFSTLNLDDIEKIGIVRGGFTEGVSDEGAVGGVIYITTKKQELGHHFYGDSSVRTYFNSNQPVDFFAQKLGYSGQFGDTFIKENVSAAWAENKYLYSKKLDGDVKYFWSGGQANGQSEENLAERENAGVKDLQNDLKVARYFGNGNCLTFSDLFYAGDKHTPGKEFSNNQGRLRDVDNCFSVDLVNPAVANCLKLQNTLCYVFNDRKFDENSTKSHHVINTGKYAGYADFYKFDFYRQSAGLTFDFTSLDSTDDGKHLQFTGCFKETSKFFWGKDRRFSLSLPLAVKFCNSNFEFIPKCGFKAEFSYVDFLFDVYRMVQFPTMDDLYWNDGTFTGNADLKPENGVGGELTLDVHDVILPFSLCVYSNYYDSKIQWSGTSAENISSAFYLGCDFRAEQTFLKGRLKVAGNCEYLYTRLLDKSNKVTYGKKIMWTPDWTGSINAVYKWPYFTLEMDASFVGKRYLTNVNAAYLKPYFLLNCSGQITKWKHCTPYFRLENLLNTQYESVEGYPMPGVGLTVGVKVIK